MRENTTTTRRNDEQDVDGGGFKLIRSLIASHARTSASHATLGAIALAVFTSSALFTGGAYAYTRSKHSLERDLPRGTHWKAAIHASRALGIATLFSLVSASAIAGAGSALVPERVVSVAGAKRAASDGAERVLEAADLGRYFRARKDDGDRE